MFRPINPKAVTRNELYGYLHPQVGHAGWRTISSAAHTQGGSQPGLLQFQNACLHLSASAPYGAVPLPLQTREWREGLMSTTFRDMANNKTNRHQWIVLDGDIDAEWVESLNTVMVRRAGQGRAGLLLSAGLQDGGRAGLALAAGGSR